MIDYLTEKGANLHITDQDGDTPLLFCEDPTIFEKLVDLGADPHCMNKQRQGIFEKVFEDENAEMVTYLYEKGYCSEAKYKKVMKKIESNLPDDDEEEGNVDGEIAEGSMSAIPEGDEAENDMEAKIMWIIM